MRSTVLLHIDDIRPALSGLDAAQRGELFAAIIGYAADDTEPNFSKDKFLAFCWGFLKPRLDADAQKYANAASQREYAAYCRMEKREGRVPLARDKWSASGEHRANVGRNPLTSTITDTFTSTITSTSPFTDTGAENRAKDGAPAGLGGAKINFLFLPRWTRCRRTSQRRG